MGGCCSSHVEPPAPKPEVDNTTIIPPEPITALDPEHTDHLSSHGAVTIVELKQGALPPLEVDPVLTQKNAERWDQLNVLMRQQHLQHTEAARAQVAKLEADLGK